MGNTVLYQLTHQSHTQMMSYVLHTANNQLVIVDGGTTADATYLLSVLKHLQCVEKPRISAWLLTHPHSDHINAMLELFRNYQSKFDVDKIYHHFPTYDFVAQYENGSLYTMQEFAKLLPRFEERIVIAQENSSISIDNLQFEVLYTTDPSFCDNAINNSSTVYRLTTEGCSVLFLGDLGVSGGDKLLRQCAPNKLKADIVQMAHHGQSGVDKSVYEAINPELCMWNAPIWLWENNQGNRGYNSGPWKIFEVRDWMSDLHVTNHIVSKDGSYQIVMSNKKFIVKPIDDPSDPLYAVPAI